MFEKTNFERTSNNIYKNNQGIEFKYENGKIIYCNDNGNEIWYEYDDSGNISYSNNSNGEERWYEYEFFPDGSVYKEKCFKHFWYIFHWKDIVL